LPVTAQSPAQPAQQFPRAAPTEFGAQRGRLTSGDSFGAHGVGERGLKLADSMFGLIDPAVLPLELRPQRLDGAFQRLDYPGDSPQLSGIGYQGCSLGDIGGQSVAGHPGRVTAPSGSARSGLARLPHLCQGDNHPDNTVVADLSRPLPPPDKEWRGQDG